MTTHKDKVKSVLEKLALEIVVYLKDEEQS